MLSKIDFFKDNSEPEPELVSVEVSGSPSKNAYNAGEELDPKGLVVTAKYAGGSTKEITSGISWAFDPATLSAGDTSCNVVATVQGVSSETYQVTGLTVTEPSYDDTYNLKNKSFFIKTDGGVYLKNTISSTQTKGPATTLKSEAQAFKFLLVGDNQYNLEASSGSYLTATSDTGGSTKLYLSSTSKIWDVTTDEETNSIELSTGGKYLASYTNGTTSDFRMYGNHSNNWKITFESTIQTLSTPTNLDAVQDGSDVTLSWSEVTGALSYSVTVKKDGTEITGSPFSVTDNSKTLKSLEVGDDYSFTVKAKGNGTTILDSDDSSPKSFEVTDPKVLTSIYVVDNTGTRAFAYGDAFNHNDVQVKAVYDDKSETDVSSASEFSTPEMSVGEHEVTVTFSGETDTYMITVSKGTLAAPTPTYSANNKTVSWSEVTNATGYQYSIDNDEFVSVSELSVDVSEYCDGEDHSITIKALGGDNYEDSTGSTNFNVPVPPTPLEGTWKLVTDASKLELGDKIILVACSYNYALSTTQNPNNRGAAAITKDTVASTITPYSDSQVITLGTSDGKKKSSSNNWVFEVDGGYLCAASSSSNHLKTQEVNDTDGQWSITISNAVASVVAQGNYTHNVLQYNNGSTLFSCYSSASQGGVAIYKLATYYTVSYDANGGENPPEGETLEKGSSFDVASKGNMSLEGFHFVGWSETEDGDPIDYAHVNSIDRDYTFYALWEENLVKMYTISFDTLGGSTVDSMEFEEGATFTFDPSNNPTKDNYSFGGWSATSGGTTPVGSFKVTENKTLYAIWNADAKTITLNANGGVGEDIVINTTYGASVKLPACTFTKDGNEFNGWATNADGSGIKYEDEATVEVTDNIVLYARWFDGTYCDIITADIDPNQGSSYHDWFENGFEGNTTGITYFAKTAENNGNIQLRSDATAAKPACGIISTTSLEDYYIREVKLTWASITAAERTVDVYGSNTAFSSYDDLLDEEKATLIGSLCVDDAEDNVGVLSLTSNYSYVGIRSHSGALYIESVEFTYSEAVQVMYSVSYDVNGGHCDSLPETQSYPEGTDVPVDTTCTPTKEFYSFEGWATSKDGTPISLIENISSDVTLYAIYSYNYSPVNDGSEEHPFTVAEACGICEGAGSTATKDKYYVRGIVSSLEDSGATPVLTDGDGHSFKGYKAASSNNQVRIGDEIILHGNLCKYNNSICETANGTGKVHKNYNVYKVTFVDGVSVDPVIQELHSGDTLIPPADPVREHYNFVGWSLDGKNPVSSFEITGDTTYTALWCANLGDVSVETEANFRYSLNSDGTFRKVTNTSLRIYLSLDKFSYEYLRDQGYEFTVGLTNYSKDPNSKATLTNIPVVYDEITETYRFDIAINVPVENVDTQLGIQLIATKEGSDPVITTEVKTTFTDAADELYYAWLDGEVELTANQVAALETLIS